MTSSKPLLDSVDATVGFAEDERKILEFWNSIDAFKTSLKKSEGRPRYSFYDGPPFATGLPHYGHILAGTIKDIVTRYAHQTGHYVERRFGWDCHGLPIEFEIEKELGIKTREQVLALGIDKYNAACRNIVMRYATEWEKIVGRLGRWIDFKNDYKTMNLSFMESVWWVFSQLHQKGLVYRGFKVMPYSVGCTTPLSNFEANSNYKEVSDPAVVVSFPIVVDQHGQQLDPAAADTPHLIAWTTTPWTLPSNLGLCLNPDLEYVKIVDNKTQRVYILAESRLVELYKPKKGAKPTDPKDYEVLAKYKGSELAGVRYKPLFDYFYDQLKDQAFRVITDPYVTSDSGTGVVHCAPGFGEDDYRVSMQSGLIVKGQVVPCPVDPNGRFVDPVTDYKGIFVKDADEAIMQAIKAMGRLVQKGSIVHSYPFCWRSETPLIYKAVPSWFVSVERFKDRLLANNMKTYWVPEFVKTKRFHNWLEDAKDWAISRTRYWGTPIPLWVSEDWEEIVAVGSIQQLSELTGKPVDQITDIHREFVDNMTIPSKRPGMPPLRRIEDVFDCFTEDHQLLTNKGFMFLSDIEQYSGTDLQFYSYDPNTDQLVLEAATAIVIKDPVEGGRLMVEMTHAAETHRWGAESDPYGRTKRKQGQEDKDAETTYSNGVSIVATPGHDMFVRLGHVTLAGVYSWDGDYHQSPGKKRSMLVPYPYAKHKASALLGAGIAVKFLAAASNGIFQASSNDLPLTELDSTEKTNSFLELYGFWLGDGSLSFTPSGTRNAVRFTVVKKHDIEWLEATFKVLELDVKKLGPYGEKNQVVFEVKQESYMRLFFDEYESKYAASGGRAATTPTHEPERTKSVKWFASWVWQLSKDQLRLIIAGLKRADGSQAPRQQAAGMKSANTIFTSSARFRDEIIRMCLLAGYSARFGVTYTAGANRGVAHNGRNIIATADNWEVSFSSIGERSSQYAEPVLKSDTDIKHTTYHGRTWCATLPHGFVIVRRAHRDLDGVVLKASRPIIAGNCWFESGSMPYAQVHYPFENADPSNQGRPTGFPANFIAEGLDQTRGWFYTLMVLGTALFDSPPFENLIVNGLVLAADGKKMSKRLKNYPDPVEVIEKYGADALRLYLINSPVVKAEPLKFKEDGVRDIVKDVFLKWNNAYRFFVQNAQAYQAEHGSLFTSVEAAQAKLSNTMDQWVISLNQSLVKFVRQEMAAYRLYTVIPKLVHDIDQLTNWYVRMNRKRLKGDSGDREDWYQALCTLYTVLLITTRTMAPFTPFLTESMYQNLKKLIPEQEREDSVHYVMVPDYDESRVNLKTEKAVDRMQQVVEVGRNIRDRKGLGLKTPIREVIIVSMDEQHLQDIRDFSAYIAEELNAKDVKTTSELKSFINLSANTNNKLLGERFKTKLKDVSKKVQGWTHEQCVDYLTKGSGAAGDDVLSGEEVFIATTFTGDASKYESQSTADKALVIINYIVDEELKQEGMVRELSSTVQQMRKKAGLVPTDKVDVYVAVPSDANGDLLRQIVDKYQGILAQSLKGMQLVLREPAADAKVHYKSDEDVLGQGFTAPMSLVWQQ